ncbi:MAG: leucine-rich repeat domain-containing protein [Opitutales bacterium]
MAGLTELTVLRLGGNQISDVTPLEGLTNLTKLFIYDNKVADLAPLAELKNLETLWLDGNPIPEDGKEMLEKALPNCFIDISRTP